MSHIIDSSQVMERYPETQKVGGSTELDAAYITPAEYYIEGMLSSKYTTPFIPTNVTAADLSIDESYYRMMLTRSPKRAAEVKKSIEDRIEKILNESMVMVDSEDGAMQATSSPMWSSTQDYEPVFGMGDIADARVDPDQVEAEENAKL